MNFKFGITIFTDGASRGNPGPGGWGAIIVEDDNELKDKRENINVVEIGGREEHTTNNRMELTAAIRTLEFLSRSAIRNPRSTIYSDSSYLINGVTKWIYGWQKRDWKTTLKEEVLNRDLWERLIKLIESKKIDWKYVGGHVGILGNERCDLIATGFADGNPPKLFSGKLEDYPIPNILDISGDENFDKANAEKSSKRVHSRATAYSYVSMVDGIIATHKTWAECEAAVRGKSGARYRKSISREDERRIVDNWKRV